MKQKYIVTLTSTERNQIQEIANDHTISNTIRKRANILLLADTTPGKPMPQAEIAKRCSTSTITVYNTLKSYTTHDPVHTLKFKRTKTTNPPTITGDKEAQIIALACNQPPQGFARWTIRLLTQKTIELNILETVSRETIRNTLKKRNFALT
jgi:hypothetical protein